MNTTIKPSMVRTFRSTLKKLRRSLAREYQSALHMLSGSHDNPERVMGMQCILARLAELGKRIRIMVNELDVNCLAEVYSQLGTFPRELTILLQETSQKPSEGRMVVVKVISLLVAAEEELGGLLFQSFTQPPKTNDKTHVIVPTDMLFQSYQALFPAERMLVVAGRMDSNRILMGATFDVTGECSAGHVRADPRKLGQALIAMTATSTHLAAWLHSHPGGGPGGTQPSSIDRRQHLDWLNDYSPRLLSGVFVQDRHLRFWGQAIEQGMIELDLKGDGIKMEDGHEHLYTLNFC